MKFTYEKLTFSQVLDVLTPSEIAIKIDVNYEISEILNGYLINEVGIHYDPKDNNILKSLNGNELIIAYTEFGKEEHFVIIKRELYNSIFDLVKRNGI